jgi:hypothetical protein
MEMDYLDNVPYLSGVPLLFTYRQTAAVSAGQYDFTGTMQKNAFTPSRPILSNVMYLINTMSFAMDIAEEDYQGSIQTLPEFSIYTQSEGGAPGFREPLVLSRYFERMPYLLPLLGKELLQESYPGASAAPTAQGFRTNRLLGLVTGLLNQTASLLGKVAITAIVQFTAQEIASDSFIAGGKVRAKSASGI